MVGRPTSQADGRVKLTPLRRSEDEDEALIEPTQPDPGTVEPAALVL